MEKVKIKTRLGVEREVSKEFAEQYNKGIEYAKTVGDSGSIDLEEDNIEKSDNNNLQENNWQKWL